MKISNPFIEFIIRFAITLAVAVIVSFVYSYLAHGIGQADWDFCVRIAAILAAVITISRAFEKKQ